MLGRRPLRRALSALVRGGGVRAALRGAAALVVFAFGSPASASDALLAGYDVVLVVIDTLRADHVGAYGYARGTTPFLDALSRDGVVLTRARSNSSFTRESIATAFTGRLPTAGGATGWRANPQPDVPTLAERLGAAGYQTGFFVATAVLGDDFSRGFARTERIADNWDTSGLGHELVARAAQWVIEARERGRFFLYLHFLDPHGPYEPPAELRARFPTVTPPHPLHLYRDVLPRLTALKQEGFGPGDARFEDLVARYDAELADVDRALRALFVRLQASGAWRRTLVVVTADHGEEFLEHGSLEHGWTLYEESVRVPLVFWAPGRLTPGRSDANAALVDLAPTLEQLLGLAPVATDGAPLFLANGAPDARPRGYTGELLIAHRNALRSRIEGRWKYVEALRWREPAERAATRRKKGRAREVLVSGPVVRRELFDLEADPHERHDRLGDEPEVAARLGAALATWVAQSAKQTRAAEAPVSDAEREQLRALGYVDEGE